MTTDRPSNRLSPGSRLSESTVRRLVGAGLALAGLLVVLSLTVFVPAVDRAVDALAIAPMALGIAIATVLVVVTLLILAPTSRAAVEEFLDGPEDVVAHAGASTMYLVIFAAISIAYQGLAGALTPLFEAFGIGGLYHLAFLVLGLLALGALATHLYRCWQPVTDVLTLYLLEPERQPDTDESTVE